MGQKVHLQVATHRLHTAHLWPNGKSIFKVSHLVTRIRGYGYGYAIRGYQDKAIFRNHGYGDTSIYTS